MYQALPVKILSFSTLLESNRYEVRSLEIAVSDENGVEVEKAKGGCKADTASQQSTVHLIAMGKHRPQTQKGFIGPRDTSNVSLVVDGHMHPESHICLFHP